MTGVTLTRQTPADADLRIPLRGQPPKEFWDGLTSGRTFIRLVSEAARKRLAAITPAEAGFAQNPSYLIADGVDALDGAFAHAAASLARVDQNKRTAAAVVRAFGSGDKSLGLTKAFDEVADGPGRLFARTSVTPTIAVEVAEAFREQRKDQRVDILTALSGLANGCDVHLVGTTMTHTFLRESHRDELGCVDERCNDQQDIPALVEAAAAEVAPTSREGRVLEEIAASDAEELSYDALESRFTVTRQTIRGAISTLVDLELVRTFDRSDGRVAMVTQAGRQFYTEEIARQRRLGDSVFAESNSSIYSRVDRPHLGEGETGSGGGRSRTAAAADVEYLPAWEHQAVAAGAPEGGFALCDHPVPEWDKGDRGWAAPRLSVNQDRSEVATGVGYLGPLPYWVSVARALTSPKALRQVYTDERLDGGEFGDLLNASLGILRDGRCTGYLPNTVDCAADYRDELDEARKEMLDMTRELKNREGEDTSDLRGEILKVALGLAGTAVHVADLAGFDVTHEVRLHEFSRRFDEDRKRDLATTLAIGATIQSVLGEHHAGYRQLLEPREDKRNAALSINVDAADPFGECLSSFVLVGPGVEGFDDTLQAALDREVHEDAPEAAIEIPVQVGGTRAWTARAVSRICSRKRFRPTREAITTLHAFSGSPFDVADGVSRALSKEDDADRMGREIRADEVRRVLASLPDGRLGADLPRSAASIVQTLCAANCALTTAELVEYADVSKSSLYNHRDKLAALGLVEQTDAGWRLTLSHADEMGDRYPDPITESWTLHDAYVDLCYAHFDDALTGDAPILDMVFGGDPPDIERFREASPWDDAWDRLAAAVTHDDRRETDGVDTVRLGGAPDQQALPGVAA